MVIIVYYVLGAIGGIIAFTFVLYGLVTSGSWLIRTFSKLWSDIISKGYYDILLPVYDVSKWLWIIPHRTFQFLRLYDLIKLVYNLTIRNFSQWFEKILKEKVVDFKNRKSEKKKNSYNKTKRESKKSLYIVLGLNENATLEEIKKAYRDLSQQYHPDKVAHLGKDLQELANQKFLEINQAYDELKKLK